MSNTALVIGAGPAGLTAALELQKNAGCDILVAESDAQVGGIAKTAVHNGNRMDIGGHRFFSKSDWVMDWWFNLLPLQGYPARDDLLLKRNFPWSNTPNAPDPEKADAVMLIRERLSRIFYRRKYFNYPISPSFETFINLGPMRTARILASYMRYALVPMKDERNLEQFFTNRFGRELYLTFFKDYTEKVWGLPCDKIDRSWGAQRVKGLSVKKLILHALTKPFRGGSLRQKSTETSLIEQFFYPKLGPGQLWELAAARVRQQGGKILPRHSVRTMEVDGNTITSVTVQNLDDGTEFRVEPAVVFSSMAIKDLVAAIADDVPEGVRSAASALPYRDFITVGVLSDGMKMKNRTARKTVNDIVPDNWIYVQEPDVRVGRLQIFNNWSPYMTTSAMNAWIGMEYFCQEGDSLWSLGDTAMCEFAVEELCRLGFVEPERVLDVTALRVKKAYPAYFGSYGDLPAIRSYLDKIKNLYCIGRNGMHRYNNMDHSMLTAREAVSCMLGRAAKDDIWQINSEDEYHESK